MDRGQFDALARVVFADMKKSRRAALATVLGATLLRHGPDAAGARTRNRKRKVKAAASTCYPGTRCDPGRGRNTSKCDFSFSTLFRNKDVRGSNISNSTFRGADLRGADLRSANLGGSCFVGADLSGAKLGSSVNLGGATFCNTIMPDGSVNDSGCSKLTSCCPALERDCADAYIICGFEDGFGFCSKHVGRIGPIAHCYQFPCCGPCENNDEDYWSSQCNLTIPECNGNCVAVDTGTLPCFEGCAG